MDSISIEQQIDLCQYEARGEVFKTYVDRGYSGKNTNRPQFTQMMNDIKDGFIHAVIVYKLDRISRSILDFSNMMEIFSKYKVQFISATEKFDTSSPMGNAMLNICIVFAQLERETIQKRVTDAYYSRSRKSFYMGGPVPYGFRKVPTVIDGIHTSMYEPVPEEADVVRLIYEMYSQPNTSYGDIINKLKELGIKKRDKDWARPRIRDILVNPIYVMADLDIYNFL
ncbi:MAG TPA: recombinase family protein [Ruminococcus flavefaciens]|nr:recombinase family protein [Ruminococcus flavefaciens]